MKAIRIHDYGDADALVYEDAPIPEPPPDGVLIKVHAAGVNPVDWKIRKGLMRAMRPLQFPAIMGSDIAGTVALAGPLVTRLKEGDRVIARVDGPTRNSRPPRPMRSRLRHQAFRWRTRPAYRSQQALPGRFCSMRPMSMRDRKC